MKAIVMKLFGFVVVSLVISCTHQKAGEPVPNQESTIQPPSLQMMPTPASSLSEIPTDTIIPATDRKYGVASGILTMDLEIEGANSTMKTTVYFDHFGKRESSETYSSTTLENGQHFDAHVMAFNLDGYQYQIDFDHKSASKFKYNPEAMSGGFSFATMTEKMKKAYNVKKVGSETILGRICDVYTMDSPDVKGTFSVWKNITFKLHTVSGGFTTNVIARKFVENVPIPKEKFEVPAGFKLTITK